MSAPYGLILAGGRGTRFWPRSRRASAKQVLTFFGERSLIQQTVDRLGPVIAPERIWILTNDHLRDTIVKQLPEVPGRQILAEPAQRNTAPAIGLAAHILESIDPGAVMGVFPADHVIGDAKEYRRLLRPAIKSAREGNLVVLGIKPRWAETGYGYIEFSPGNFAHGGSAHGNDAGTLEPLPVKRFREKPDAATAARFVRKGNFYWNAGMFFWRASVLLEALRKFLPNTAALLDGLPAFGSRGFEKRVADVFPQCENISIDYAVLEKSPKVVGFAAGEFGWNDVGSWNAVYELARRDADSNVLLGDTLVEASSGTYSHVPGKLVALLGVKDLIVVDTPGALLIADRHRAQQVGDLVKRLEKAGRAELL
jgi:mannose-1-phosphate guanylyltransferase